MPQECGKNLVDLMVPISVCMLLRKIPVMVFPTLKTKLLPLGKTSLHNTRTEKTGSFPGEEHVTDQQVDVG